MSFSSIPTTAVVAVGFRRRRNPFSSLGDRLKVYKKVTWPAFMTIALCGAVSAVAAAPLRYEVIEIAPTSLSQHNFGEDLNNLGVGAGRMSSSSSTSDRGLVFRNGVTEKIGILPSTGSSRRSDAFGINDEGYVVGDSTFANSSQTHAFLWTGTGDLKDLGTMRSDGSGISEARDINNAGQITGRVSTPSGLAGPFFWENDTFIDLLQTGEDSGRGSAINELGHIAGWTRNSGDHRAFIWRDRNGNGVSDPGDRVDLGLLPGFENSFGYGINDADQVVGHLQGGSNTDPGQPFLWQDTNSNGMSDPGEMTLLPQLPGAGDNPGRAWDINNSGQIVGSSNSAATLWQDGSAYDLNDLALWPQGASQITLGSATAINNSGQILVDGSVSTSPGRVRVYLLNPIPEPSGLALLAVGITALLPSTRRRHRS